MLLEKSNMGYKKSLWAALCAERSKNIVFNLDKIYGVETN
jgi:hypothetical protein